MIVFCHVPWLAEWSNQPVRTCPDLKGLGGWNEETWNVERANVGTWERGTWERGTWKTRPTLEVSRSVIVFCHVPWLAECSNQPVHTCPDLKGLGGWNEETWNVGTLNVRTWNVENAPDP